MSDRTPARIETIAAYHCMVGTCPPVHPLISFLRFDETAGIHECAPRSFSMGFYAIALKQLRKGSLRYGQRECDFSNNALFAMAPGQVLSVTPGTEVAHAGWRLLVHPDLLFGTGLARTIRSYPFFSYKTDEALQLTATEEDTLTAIARNIEREYAAPGDGFTAGILVSQLELLLQYISRFYGHQLQRGGMDGHTVLSRFELALDAAVTDHNLPEHGLPTVQNLAAALALSPDYLSGMLKELTGRGAQQHIQDRLILIAKEKLSTTGLSIGEIAYEMGFGHTQSFAKLFKSKTALTPLAYRRSFTGEAAG